MRDYSCFACGLTNCSCGCYGDPDECVCGTEVTSRRPRACITCGLIDCPCGCNGDPNECVCDIEARSNPDACEEYEEEYEENPTQYPSEAAQSAAQRLALSGAQTIEEVEDTIRFWASSGYEEDVRRNPVCGKCGIEDCECQTLGYCVCDKRRNPDPDGKPWGPSLYNPLNDRYNEFKDDSSYRSIASRFRRNPWIDIGDEYE